MHNHINELIPTRMSLLTRLKNWDDQEGWTRFFETYWKLIYATAINAGLTDSEAQDVVQETVIAVLKSMPEFRYNQENGSFKSWLLRLTSWRIRDHLRKQPAEAEPTEPEAPPEGTDIVDPELEATWDEEWEQNLLSVATEKVKKKVDPKHYQAFDLYVVKGWPVSKVAQTLLMSRGKVYVVKHRIGNLVKREIAQLREKPF